MRRPLLAASVCLLSGALITTLIAWLAAATSETDWYHGETTRAAVASDVPPYLRSIFPPPIQVSHRNLRGIAVTESETWCCADPSVLEKKYEWNEGPLRPAVERFAFGLPMRAMYYDMYLCNGGSKQERQDLFAQCRAAAGWRAAQRFPAWFPVASGSFRAMPRAVLPLGFAIDALIFGFTLPVCVLAIGRIRRWRRRRRGWCPACGYNRAGLPCDAKCPECGTLPPPGPEGRS
jgi:hypothetical protein